MKGYQTAGGFISNKIADIITQIVPSESTTPAQTENYTKNIIQRKNNRKYQKKDIYFTNYRENLH